MPSDRAVWLAPWSLPLAEQLCRAPLDFIGRHILDMRGNVPSVTERIEQSTHAVTIEHVLNRAFQLGTCLDGPSNGRIHIMNV